MKTVTQFPEGATHVLAKQSGPKEDWYTLRKINANGYTVVETSLGLIKLRVPYQELHGDPSDAYWEVLGYFDEVSGEIAKNAWEQYSNLNGRNVMRNLRADEQKVRLAA